MPIGSMIDQILDHGQLTINGGQNQGPIILRMNVGPMGQQEINHSNLAISGRQDQTEAIIRLKVSAGERVEGTRWINDLIVGVTLHD
jgi:hypothetical protein